MKLLLKLVTEVFVQSMIYFSIVALDFWTQAGHQHESMACTVNPGSSFQIVSTLYQTLCDMT